MNNHTEIEEIEENNIPIQTAIRTTQKKEYSEQNQKKILKPKINNLSDKLSQSQIIPTKSIELPSSKENQLSPSETKDLSNKSVSNKLNRCPKIKFKELKDDLDHISLKELSDDENAENPIIIKTKSSYRSQSINNKEIKSFRYCGKKRKYPAKEKERIKSEIQKKNNGKSVENNKKKKITNFNKDKNIIYLNDENNIDDKRRNNIPEKKILSNLVKKEGFKKIFEYLSIFPLNRKNPIERELDDVLLNIGLLRTTILLFQIQMEEMEKSDENNNNNKNINIKKLFPINNILNLSKNNHIEKSDSTTVSEKENNIEKIHILDDEVEEEKKPIIKKLNETEKRIKSAPKEKNSNNIKISNNKDIKNIPKKKNNLSSSKMVSIKKETLHKEFEINVHLQKDKDGKIYKYAKHHLCSNKGNSFYVFYCADTRCRAKACYYVKTMKFENITEHKLSHSEHSYIRNMNREDKYNPIVEEFIKRNYHEAQIFLKNDGTQLVKWYDQF